MLASPPHLSQLSASRLKTRFNRFAQVIEARFSAGVWSTSLAGWRFLSLPRPAGVTFERYLLLGANTPWKRVRLTLGLGISETRGRTRRRDERPQDAGTPTRAPPCPAPLSLGRTVAQDFSFPRGGVQGGNALGMGGREPQKHASHFSR
jgi:hypothetical protein